MCVCVCVGGWGLHICEIHSFKVSMRKVSLMSYSHLNLGRWFGMIRGGGGMMVRGQVFEALVLG